MSTQTPPGQEMATELDRLRELVRLKDEELGRIEEARTRLYRALQERDGELEQLRKKRRNQRRLFRWWRSGKEAT